MNTEDDKNNRQYMHQTVYTYRERLVGLFVFTGFILFLSFIVISVKNQHLFEQRVTFYLNIDSSEGVSQGTLVKALGTEIGRVSDMRYTQEGQIRVALEIYQGRRTLIREGAVAVVNRLTSIGNALIEIKSDSFDAPILPADLLLSIANLIQVTDSKKLIGKVDTILPKLEQTLGNVHAIIEKIASGSGTIGAAVFDQTVEQDLKVVVKSGAEILLEAEGIMTLAKQRLRQLEPVLHDTRFIVKDVRGMSRGLPELVQELHEIVAQAKTAITLVNSELHDLPGISIELRRALSKTDNLLDSVQNTWPLSQHLQNPRQQRLIPAHSNHE